MASPWCLLSSRIVPPKLGCLDKVRREQARECPHEMKVRFHPRGSGACVPSPVVLQGSVYPGDIS